MSLDQPDITNQTASEFSIKRDSTHDDAQTTPPNLTVNGTRVAEKEPASNDQTKLEHGTQDIQDALEYSHGFVFVCLTLGLMAVVLVIAMDNYIISTAIPRITSDFENLNLVGWYGSSYFLTLMSFQPAFGQLCTLFPMKIVYLVSLVAFEIGSTISASAPTSIAFIVGRLVSGAAGGGLWCGTLTLMAHAVPTSKRHLYVSVVTSMYGVASAIGPILGGIFADSAELTWRFCFWINLRKTLSRRMQDLMLTCQSYWVCRLCPNSDIRQARKAYSISFISLPEAEDCKIRYPWCIASHRIFYMSSTSTPVGRDNISLEPLKSLGMPTGLWTSDSAFHLAASASERQVGLRREIPPQLATNRSIALRSRHA